MTDVHPEHGIVLRAAVFDPASGHAARVDAARTRHHLRRIELAAQSYWGTIIRRNPEGVTVGFNSAEAAVLGAREMLRRCTSIQQQPDGALGVRIGIHAHAGKPNPLAVEAKAIELSTLLQEAGIVVSEALCKSLPDELNQKTEQLPATPHTPAARTIPWREIESSQHAVPPTHHHGPSNEPTLRLRLGQTAHAFAIDKTVITIGRDPRNDLVIDDPKASRSHLRILNRQEGCVLVDQSTNGTYLTDNSGRITLIKHDMAALQGSGWFTLGHPRDEDPRYTIAFACETAPS